MELKEFLRQHIMMDALIQQTAFLSQQFFKWDCQVDDEKRTAIVQETQKFAPLESNEHRMIVDTIAQSLARQKGLRDISKFIIRVYPRIVTLGKSRMN